MKKYFKHKWILWLKVLIILKKTPEKLKLAENLQILAPLLQNTQTPTDFKECRLRLTICKNTLTSALEILSLPNLIPLPNNYRAITWDKNIFLGIIFPYFDNHVQLQISLTPQIKKKKTTWIFFSFLIILTQCWSASSKEKRNSPELCSKTDWKGTAYFELTSARLSSGCPRTDLGSFEKGTVLQSMEMYEIHGVFTLVGLLKV